MNPIENIWAVFKKNTERRVVRSKNDLIDAIADEWEKIDNALIRKTIKSMPKRPHQVIERCGKKYDY